MTSLLRAHGRYTVEASISGGRGPSGITSLAPFICNFTKATCSTPSDPHTGIALYADVSTVYSSPALLCKHLQHYLEALAIVIGRFTINAMKSKVKKILKKRVPLFVSLTFNSVKMLWCSQAKYLGIIIDNKCLTPSQ
jgi:hypothetical protein